MAAHLPRIGLERVHRVCADGSHNAFTDLARWRGRFWLTWRSCPDGHGVSSAARIRVLTSDDGVSGWREAFAFVVPGRDARDPHFLDFGERLFVYTGAWLCDPARPGHFDINDHLGFGAWTEDGGAWHGPAALEGTYGHYIWRAAAWGGGQMRRAFLCGRRRRDFAPGTGPEEPAEAIQSALLESQDGLVWRTAGLFAAEFGDETAFAFEDDGRVVALVRGGGPAPARVCRARPPYADWQRVDLGRNVGGPLLARWGRHWLVGGRRTLPPAPPVTALAWLHEDALVEQLALPSGGDTSYPGFVALDDERGLLSYYSSHEGSGTGRAPCHVYVAQLRLA